MTEKPTLDGLDRRMSLVETAVGRIDETHRTAMKRMSFLAAVVVVPLVGAIVTALLSWQGMATTMDIHLVRDMHEGARVEHRSTQDAMAEQKVIQMRIETKLDALSEKVSAR